MPGARRDATPARPVRGAFARQPNVFQAKPRPSSGRASAPVRFTAHEALHPSDCLQYRWSWFLAAGPRLVFGSAGAMLSVYLHSAHVDPEHVGPAGADPVALQQSLYFLHSASQ